MSPVATDEAPATPTEVPDVPAPGADWTRTPEQEELVRRHLSKVRSDYAKSDPELRALLEDPAILDTKGQLEFLGYSTAGNRIYQLATNRRDLADADQVPHPSAPPEPDVSRSKRNITGIMAGRLALWAIVSGRKRWDPIRKTLVDQDAIQFGGAPSGDR